MAVAQDETVLAIQEEEKTSKAMTKASLLESVEAGLEITDDMKNSVFQIIDELKEEYEKDASKKVSAAGVFRNPKRFMWFLAIFASIGGFLYGIDISLISGALLFMKVDLNLDTSQQSLVSSGMSLGGVAGALISMPVNELVGRKYSIIVACILCTVGAILEAAAHDYGTMVAGRLILGAGVGLEAMTIPTYISECSQKRRRGGIVSLYQVLITFGILAGYVVNAIFVKVPGNWRFMMGSSLLFSTILLVSALFFPESPRWLMRKGRRVDAYATWLAVRGFDVEEEKIEFAIMEEVVIAEREASKDRFLYLDFIRIPHCRRAAIHGILMMVFQQFSGNNSMTYFLGTMYERAGLSAENSVYISMLGGGTMFWSTIPAIYLMDRFGRRPLLLILVPGVVAGLIITGFSFYAPTTTSLIVVYTIGVVSYYAFWGSALGPTPWVMNSEIYPTYIRSYGMSLGTLSNFLGNWITTYAFLQMLDAMTKPGTYIGFYGGITVIGWFYFLFFTPETKNLTLEEIKAVFSKTWIEIAKHNMEDFRYHWNKFWHKRRAQGMDEQAQTVSP
ncbi:hypothetical protein GpartN1_g6315.t1 [Galdieria partita]|uniref:Major facilitator superfamily (MFS) profile domain-containing protein n=1 Tax=Galdieria partita TaxID=83374 RepID=A0A9C7Q2B6_9RHOD|nr:hypothetical protein GpartN1_g6315.t1 [Galdieria partita]